MSKYIVETFYTCSFKIVHKLDELNEKKLSELENRKDGEVQIIDVKLNNRKTKTINKKDKFEDLQNNLKIKNTPIISSLINEKIATSDKTQVSNLLENKNLQKFDKIDLSALTILSLTTFERAFNSFEIGFFKIESAFLSLTALVFLLFNLTSINSNFPLLLFSSSESFFSFNSSSLWTILKVQV